MASTASTVAIAMEIVAALGTFILSILHEVSVTYIPLTDLFYDTRLNGAVAIFQIFSSQMLGYGIAGMREFTFHPRQTSI